MQDNKRYVIIDCDPGTDDVTSMLYLFARPEIEVVGITPVGGNKELSMCEEISLAVVEQYAPYDIPVAKGEAVALNGIKNITVPGYCLGGAKLPAPQKEVEDIAACDFIYQKALQYSGKLELLVIGPHMNVGLAFKKYPDLKDHIKAIYMMGGTADKGNITPYAEYNFGADPEASQYIVNSGVPLVVMPLGVCGRAYITDAEIDDIGTLGRTGTFLHEMLAGPIYRSVQNGRPGCGQCDPTAAVYMIRPEIFTCEEVNLTVVQQGEQKGKTVFDKNGVVNARIGVDVDREAFVSELRESAIALNAILNR